MEYSLLEYSLCLAFFLLKLSFEPLLKSPLSCCIPPALFTLFREVWVVWPPAPCRCTMFTKCCELPPTVWAGSRRFRATPYLELTIKQTDRSEKPVKAYVQEGPKLFQTWSDAVVVVTVIRRRSYQRSSIVISEVVIRSSYNRGIYK